MANTMDHIVIKYGVQLEHYPPLFDEAAQKEWQEKSKKIKTATLPEFIAKDPKELSEMEQKLQSAIKRLYQLNDREPPLFRSFPNWRPNLPLTIDATYLPKTSSSYFAEFSPSENHIFFEKTDEDTNLLDSLAHELKHAEQCSEETYNISTGTNGLQAQQMKFLGEAQAYAFATYVTALDLFDRGIFDVRSELAKTPDCMTSTALPVLLEHLGTHGHLDWPSLQQSLILENLPALYKTSYKSRYDECAYLFGSLIHEKDKSLDHIPEAFHLPDDFPRKKLLKVLKKIPRKAKSSNIRFKQLLEDGHEIRARWMMFKRDSNGDYAIPSAPVHYVEYLINKRRGKAALPFLLESSSEGKPVIPDHVKQRYFEEFLVSLPDKQAKELFQRLQTHIPPCYSENILKEIFNAIGFFSSTTSRNIATQKDLDIEEQKARKLLNFFIKQTDLPVKNSVEHILNHAVETGCVHLLQDILTAKRADGSRLIKTTQLRNYLEDSFLLFDPKLPAYLSQFMSKKHLALATNNRAEIVKLFLDLKDNSNQHIIDAATLLKIRSRYPDSPALAEYKKSHPNDIRFKVHAIKRKPVEWEHPAHSLSHTVLSLDKEPANDATPATTKVVINFAKKAPSVPRKKKQIRR